MRKIVNLIKELEKFPDLFCVSPFDDTIYIVDNKGEPVGYILCTSKDEEDTEPAEIYEDYTGDLNG